MKLRAYAREHVGLRVEAHHLAKLLAVDCQVVAVLERSEQAAVDPPCPEHGLRDPVLLVVHCLAVEGPRGVDPRILETPLHDDPEVRRRLPGVEEEVAAGDELVADGGVCQPLHRDARGLAQLGQEGHLGSFYAMHGSKVS